MQRKEIQFPHKFHSLLYRRRLASAKMNHRNEHFDILHHSRRFIIFTMLLRELKKLSDSFHE